MYNIAGNEIINFIVTPCLMANGRSMHSQTLSSNSYPEPNQFNSSN